MSDEIWVCTSEYTGGLSPITVGELVTIDPQATRSHVYLTLVKHPHTTRLLSKEIFQQHFREYDPNQLPSKPKPPVAVYSYQAPVDVPKIPVHCFICGKEIDNQGQRSNGDKVEVWYTCCGRQEEQSFDVEFAKKLIETGGWTGFLK